MAPPSDPLPPPPPPIGGGGFRSRLPPAPRPLTGTEPRRRPPPGPPRAPGGAGGGGGVRGYSLSARRHVGRQGAGGHGVVDGRGVVAVGEQSRRALRAADAGRGRRARGEQRTPLVLGLAQQLGR